MAFISTPPVTRLRIEQVQPRRRRPSRSEWVWRPGHKHMVRVPCAHA
jgi:hypothetical protein